MIEFIGFQFDINIIHLHFLMYPNSLQFDGAVLAADNILYIAQLSFRIIKNLCVVTVYKCLKIYLYKKALFIFVNNATFFSMLYHGAVEYVANTFQQAISEHEPPQVTHFENFPERTCLH